MFSDIKAVRLMIRKVSLAIKKTAKKEGLTYLQVIDAIMKGDLEIMDTLKQVASKM